MRVGFILAATALALPAAAGTAFAVPGAPGIPGAPDGQAVCEQLSGQLRGLLTEISALSEQAEGLEGLPLADLLTQITNLQNQADSVSEQLSDLVCSAIPSGGGGSVGSGSISNSADYDDYGHTPVRYGYGHRYYDDYDVDAPVVATQVDAVPRGGVATGDGSFGE
jgi:hypothetical protein